VKQVGDVDLPEDEPLVKGSKKKTGRFLAEVQEVRERVEQLSRYVEEETAGLPLIDSFGHEIIP
jgi:hypothetical protein